MADLRWSIDQEIRELTRPDAVFGPGMAPAPAVAACGPILGPTRSAAPEMVLAGGLGGPLETGRTLNYLNA